jgi:hypothetical protein
MADIKVTNPVLKLNVLLAVIVIMAIRFVFREEKSPIRCVKKFPIHLPH